MSETMIAAILGGIATLVAGALGGSFALWAANRSTMLAARQARLRDNQLEDLRHSRVLLMDRLVAQRAAIVETRRLTAQRANSLENEAEFEALRVNLLMAFGTQTFANTVIDAIENTALALAGQPVENAGLSAVACVAVMSDILRRTEAKFSLTASPHEDAMSLYANALREEQAAFDGLFAVPVAELPAGREQDARVTPGR